MWTEVQGQPESIWISHSAAQHVLGLRQRNLAISTSSREGRSFGSLSHQCSYSIRFFPIQFEDKMSCNVKQAFKLISENLTNPHFRIIDVRSQGEYQSGHIKGSQLIPLGDLAQRIKEFDKAGTYLMVCRSGARSGSATFTLNSHGFKAINMEGGMISWIAEKFPTE